MAGDPAAVRGAPVDVFGPHVEDVLAGGCRKHHVPCRVMLHDKRTLVTIRVRSDARERAPMTQQTPMRCGLYKGPRSSEPKDPLLRNRMDIVLAHKAAPQAHLDALWQPSRPRRV